MTSIAGATSIIFAEHGRTWGLGDIIVAIIICVAIIAVCVIACRVMGVVIPQWAFQILAIVVVAVVAILAIRFLLTL